MVMFIPWILIFPVFLLYIPYGVYSSFTVKTLLLIFTFPSLYIPYALLAEDVVWFTVILFCWLSIVPVLALYIPYALLNTFDTFKLEYNNSIFPSLYIPYVLSLSFNGAINVPLAVTSILSMCIFELFVLYIAYKSELSTLLSSAPATFILPPVILASLLLLKIVYAFDIIFTSWLMFVLFIINLLCSLYTPYIWVYNPLDTIVISLSCNVIIVSSLFISFLL